MKPASESTLFNDSTTDLGAAGFGLMSYREASRAKRVDNTRWYDYPSRSLRCFDRLKTSLRGL